MISQRTGLKTGVKNNILITITGNIGGGGGGEFARYVPLASQSPYPILVYFLANY